jgi:hypothetical protein
MGSIIAVVAGRGETQKIYRCHAERVPMCRTVNSGKSPRCASECKIIVRAFKIRLLGCSS